MFDNYELYEHAVASVQLFLAMLGMGTLLSPQDFISQARQPKSLSVGLLLQWCCVPFLAFVIGRVSGAPAGIAAGLLLISLVPTGVTSNVLTYLARGNIALSVSLTAITTVAALVTVPVFLHVLLQDYLPANFELPMGQVVQDIVFNLAIPLAMGMFIRKKLQSATSDNISRWLIRASLALIVVMGVGAGSTGRLDPQAYGAFGIIVVSSFCLGVVCVTLLICKLMSIAPADRIALMIKSSYRNISLGVAIKSILFPSQVGQLDPVGDGVFFTLLLYGGVSLFACITQVLVHRKLSG